MSQNDRGFRSVSPCRCEQPKQHQKTVYYSFFAQQPKTKQNKTAALLQKQHGIDIGLLGR